MEIAGEYMDGMDDRKAKLDIDEAGSCNRASEPKQRSPDMRTGMASARETRDKAMVR